MCRLEKRVYEKSDDQRIGVQNDILKGARDLVSAWVWSKLPKSG